MLPTRKGFGKGKAVDRLPAGQDDRPSQDWMDFEKADGGPKRRMVHLGEREVDSTRGQGGR